MTLYQLANDRETYGERALWWLVVSDDLEDELAGPFATQDEAEAAMAALENTSSAEG